MSGTAPSPGGIGGGGGFMGGWRMGLAAGALALAIGGAWWFIDALVKDGPPPPPRPASPPGVVGNEFPQRPPAPVPTPVRSVGAPQPEILVQRPARRPRPSAMVMYDDPAPPRAPERVQPAAAAAPAEVTIAGMRALRAEVLPEPEWWLMPGDKIQCSNLEPLTARTGAPFSATVPHDVKGRTGKTLLPRGSRVFGTVAKGLEHGQERLVALLSHAEGPSVPGRPTVVVPLGDAPAADVIGQVDLEGNVNTHFWSRLGAVAAYAGLDLISTAGGAVAGAAISDAVSGASGGRSIGFYNFGGMGRSLADQEYGTQMRRPPSFELPQGQPCQVFVTRPIDFRSMKAYQ